MKTLNNIRCSNWSWIEPFMSSLRTIAPTSPGACHIRPIETGVVSILKGLSWLLVIGLIPLQIWCVQLPSSWYTRWTGHCSKPAPPGMLLVCGLETSADAVTFDVQWPLIQINAFWSNWSPCWSLRTRTQVIMTTSGLRRSTINEHHELPCRSDGIGRCSRTTPFALSKQLRSTLRTA